MPADFAVETRGGDRLPPSAPAVETAPAAGRPGRSGKLLRHGLVVALGIGMLLAVTAPGLLLHLFRPVIDAADARLVAHGFGVARVSVSGLNRTSEAELRAALGEIDGRSVLRFDVAAAAKRVERLGWIARANVTRRLPNALHISVTEHAPFAIWQSGGRVFLIARDGNIIARNPGAEFGDLPLVSGLAANLAAAEILDALALHPEISAQVKSIARVGARRWNLQLDNGLVIKLPERQPRQALAVLDRLETGFRILHRDLEGIDLRLSDRVTLNLTPDAATRRDFLLNRGRAKNRGGADT